MNFRAQHHGLPLAGAACLLMAAGAAQSALAADGIRTVWSIEGSDVRGHYTGQLELVPDGNAYAFSRIVDYDTVEVEGGRKLSWAWQGRAVAVPGGGYALTAELQKADFVRSRGELLRTDADRIPARVVGQFQPAGRQMRGGFTLDQRGETAISETWSNPTAGGSRPIFALEISETPTHNAIPSSSRDSLFRSYASFHRLPAVQPFANRPEFRNPIHTAMTDRTDHAFYQANPQRLRVVNKVIDPISLQETLARADAYKWTLAGKADYFDEALAVRGIDPDTGLVFEFVENNGVGAPSHDAALWTGAYMASQYLRHQVTGNPEALANIARSAQGLTTLIEITGNPSTFARTLRKAGTTPPVAPWMAGTGRFAGLEWKSGGNNDMFKGVMLGLTVAQAALCDRPTGYADLCGRIKDDAVQIVLKLDQAQGNSYNRLAALWLAAYSTREPVLLTGARKEWNRQSTLLSLGSNTFFSNGTADWSGTHLAAVQYLLFNLLTDRQPLPGVDTRAVLRRGVENIYRNFSRVPMGLWSVAFARLGTLPHADAAQDALWRLREIPAPKTSLDIDHRIAADYVMSPFPSLPWKNDWSVNDRTQSLRMYPLFESSAHTVYAWKHSPLEYRAKSTSLEYPGADYLFGYWLARYLGIVSGGD